jgi:two-component system sensor histidine kinase KdpD
MVLDDVRMKTAAEGQDIRVDRDPLLRFAPLRLGSKVIGSMGVSGLAFSAATLRALGGLIAVSIERAGAIEHMAKMTAVRESEHFKSVLLDAITHDFRTPLTCIKSSVTGLLDDPEFEPAEKKDMLTVIDEECDRINQLLDKASEMARLESNKVRLKLAPHSVGELISAAVADCRAISRSRPMQFEIRNQESLVSTDLPLAKSVLLHLIANAHLYSSPGEPITIRSSDRDGYSLFSVADRGPGIEEREAALIFEKFYRCESSGKRARGTGMGLPIALAIVEAHGGTIDAVSEVGHGSEFTFSLPLVSPGEFGIRESRYKNSSQNAL